MPRETQRRKTQRAEASGTDLRPTQLQPNRRFFQAGGYDKNVRAARALENAFKTGSQFILDEQNRRNAEGRSRGLTEAAAGGERDLTDQQAGYLRAWDEVDAEYDYNLAVSELPEVLRTANAEELTDEQRQGVISDYMESMFAGAAQDPDSHYGRWLAPKLLEMEAELVNEYRAQDIEKHKQELRVKLYTNASASFAADGVVNFQGLWDQSGDLFESGEKKVMFWETIRDLAVKSGAPEVFDQVPEFINGIPTANKDPKFLTEIRGWRNEALAVQSRKQTERLAAEEKMYKRQAFDIQNVIAERLLRGESAAAEIELLKQNPVATFAMRTAAENFGNSQFDLREKRAAEPLVMRNLWDKIHREAGNPATLQTAIMEASNQGFLGLGETGVDNFRQMMAAVASYADNPVLTSESATQSRAQINRHFNSSLSGPVPDGFIARVNADAHARFNALLMEGKPAMEALNIVTNELDTVIENAPIADVKALSTKTSLREFNEQFIVTAENVQRVLDGKASYSAVFGGISQQDMGTILLRKVEANELTEDQVNRLFE